ncbi:MAG: nuclear transport factor 2 family protein [Actinomycetota bacterium]
MDSNRETAEAFWEALARRDFDGAASSLHPEFVEDWPQSGERIVGVPNWLRMVNEHPTFPTIQHMRTIGGGGLCVSECRFDYGDGTPWAICAVQEFRDGKIARITEYFGSPFEAAEWRTDIVERIPS